MADPNLIRLATYAAALKDASTIEELDNLYIDWIGYSLIEDDPEMPEWFVRDMLFDYLHACCTDYGFDLSDIGL